MEIIFTCKQLRRKLQQSNKFLKAFVNYFSINCLSQLRPLDVNFHYLRQKSNPDMWILPCILRISKRKPGKKLRSLCKVTKLYLSKLHRGTTPTLTIALIPKDQLIIFSNINRNPNTSPHPHPPRSPPVSYSNRQNIKLLGQRKRKIKER